LTLIGLTRNDYLTEGKIGKEALKPYPIPLHHQGRTLEIVLNTNFGANIRVDYSLHPAS
jgi:hypothetical protein